jgi:hypothetical protein
VVATFGLNPTISTDDSGKQLPAKVAREGWNRLLQTKTCRYAAKKPKRTTRLELATFGLGSRRSTN